MALRDNFALEDMHRTDIMGFMQAATGSRWQQAPRDLDLHQGTDLVTDRGFAGRPMTAGMRVRRTTQNGEPWLPATYAKRSREITIRCSRDDGSATEAQKQPFHGVDYNVYALAHDPPNGQVRTAVVYRASALYGCGLLDELPAIPNHDGTWFKAVAIDAMPPGIVLATYGIAPVDGASRLERDAWFDWVVLAAGFWALPREDMARLVFHHFSNKEAEQFSYDVLRLSWRQSQAA